MNSTERERREVHYSGRVQGVGFRYTTRRIAARFDVTGYVRNLPDGRVEMVTEGSPKQLKQFLAEVALAMRGYIHDTTVQDAPAGNEFAAFEIRHY